MARWYPAHNYTPADPYSLQAVPNPGDYTDLDTGDMALVYYDGRLDVLIYDSTSSAAASIPLVVTPDGNAGDGRWLRTTFTSNIVELSGAGDTDLHTHNSIIAGDTQIAITDAGTGTVEFIVDSGTIIDLAAAGVRLGAGGARVSNILDEDAMGTDSDTALATQQSIKAYVDTYGGGGVLTPTTYTSTGAISTSAKFIELDGTTGALAMTIAAPVKGQSAVITCTNADNESTVTLTSGDFYFVSMGIEGSGNVATFNTVGQTLTLFAVSTTRYIVIQNIGQVGIE